MVISAVELFSFALVRSVREICWACDGDAAVRNARATAMRRDFMNAPDLIVMGPMSLTLPHDYR